MAQQDRKMATKVEFISSACASGRDDMLKVLRSFAGDLGVSVAPQSDEDLADVLWGFFRCKGLGRE